MAITRLPGFVIDGTSSFTFANVSVTSNVTASNANLGNAATANYFIGNGSLLTGITATTAQTVTTAAQPNITSVGTLTLLTVTGNITSGNAALGNLATANFFTGSGNLLSNIQGANVTGAVTFATTANAVAGANVSGQVANALVAGTVYTAAQPNITSVGILSNLTVSGNIFAGALVSNTAYDTRIELGTGSGIIAISTAGNATQFYPSGQINLGGISTIGGGTFAGSMLELAGSQTNLKQNRGGTVTVQVGADGTIANTWTFAQDGSFTSPGNVNSLNANLGNTATANFFIGNGSMLTGISSGSGSAVVNGNSNVSVSANSNITLSVAGNANIITVTGTGANISGYLDVAGTTKLGAVGNITITGGTSGQFLQTNGSGTLSWAAIAGLSVLVDEFAGDGATTAFTLSSAPSSENFTLVSIAGTFQPRSTYTVAGSTITFSSAPPNTSPIEVTTFGGAVASGSGGTYVTRVYTGTGSQTNFTVTAGVTVDSVLVTENGIVQVPTVDYTVSGTTLTFVTAPNSGIVIQLRELAAGGSSGATYESASANITAVANTKYILDTSTIAITITLPTSPTLGQEIGILDGTGNAATNTITVFGNGANIQGAAGNMTVSTARAAFTLVYYNSAQGWILTNV